ncbi:MAG: glutaredoxin family protein [Candidatus Pacebacteria bacterium]|nr:glutaredoxin family protein [Candidatus Paceibacterota bacterium]
MSNKNVRIYSTPGCVYCKMAKDFFKKAGVEYTEFNVAENLEAREEAKNKSHQTGVPVIDINGEIFVGFNRTDIKQALGIK